MQGRLAPTLLLGFIGAACGSQGEKADEQVGGAGPATLGASPASAERMQAVIAREAINGRWRFVLQSPGGELPFFVEVDGQGAHLFDGYESLAFSELRFDAGRLGLDIHHYDSRITGDVQRGAGGELTLVGEWTRRSPGVDSFTRMKVRGALDASRRAARFEGARASLAGRWRLVFREEDGSSYAGVAKLEEGRGGGVSGTILTDTGDYRYLRGGLDGDELRLSVFDGAHAFLFHATLQADGSLAGDFWSRDTYHASFTGEPLASGELEGLADPFAVVELTAKDRRFRFDFPALGGGRLTHTDSRFAGKPLVVEIFGTWCPNCNDQAPLMSKWYAEYQPRGLEMVGIAFEFTGEQSSDMDMLKRYAEKYDVAYPLALGGTNDKSVAAKALPELSKVAAYPTTLFIDRRGRVEAIYSGFSGPATGKRFAELERQFRAQMEALVAP